MPSSCTCTSSCTPRHGVLLSCNTTLETASQFCKREIISHWPKQPDAPDSVIVRDATGLSFEPPLRLLHELTLRMCKLRKVFGRLLVKLDKLLCSISHPFYQIFCNHLEMHEKWAFEFRLIAKRFNYSRMRSLGSQVMGQTALNGPECALTLKMVVPCHCWWRKP